MGSLSGIVSAHVQGKFFFAVGIKLVVAAPRKGHAFAPGGTRVTAVVIVNLQVIVLVQRGSISLAILASSSISSMKESAAAFAIALVDNGHFVTA